MKYPYLLYSDRIEHAPIFKNLAGDPFVIDLSYKNELLERIDVGDQRAFQAILEKKMAELYTWGLSGYLERRDSLLRDCFQMVSEKRYFHLGLDIIVPVGKALCAPLDAVVEEAGHEEGHGNYGGFVLLRHEREGFETFYSFYGHLNLESLPEKGRKLSAGQKFARTGDFDENGNWFYHTHLQVITAQGLSEGYMAKGYCAEKDLARIDDLCPSPLPLFIRRP